MKNAKLSFGFLSLNFAFPGWEGGKKEVAKQLQTLKLTVERW